MTPLEAPGAVVQWAADPSRSVFVNCPFDPEYESSLQAIVMGCVACGFTPRSAIDIKEAARPRLERILQVLCQSHFSIHDLSRCKGEGEQALARFNMPLELGMAIARQYLMPEDHRDILILVPNGHDYVRFVSDLAGIDPRAHDGTPAMILRRVMAWLAPSLPAPPPSPPEVEPRLAAFAQAWSASRAAWGEPQWWTLVERARALVAEI